MTHQQPDSTSSPRQAHERLAALLGTPTQLLDVIEQAVIITDLEGTILYWNQCAEALYGWGADEATGRNVLDVTPDLASQPGSAQIMARLAAGEKWSGEFLARRKNGTTFWAQVTDSPIRDDSGHLIGIVGFSTDISERRQFIAQIKEQAETIATINRIGQTLSAELDLHRLVQLVTDAATALTGAEFGAFFYNVLNERGESYQLYTLSGAPHEAFAGFPMPRNTDVFGPTFRGEAVIRSANIREDPRYGHMPPYNGMPPGHLPVTSYLAVPVVSRSGEVLGGLFFGHSAAGVFTERAEQLVVGIAAQTAIAMDNAQLFEQAQQAIRARDRFLSMASHEIRTPITSILGNIQLLQRRVQRGQLDVERNTRTLQTMYEQTHRLIDLVNALFDLSRINLGQLDLERDLVDVPLMLQSIVDAMQPSLYHHTLVYRREVESLLLEADALRLEQIIHNLLLNAVKYSPHGGPIEIGVRRLSDYVHISVTDQGIGIPPRALPHIFDRFYRADNVLTTQISGMGMGLYVVRELVSLHGGVVEVETVEGAGSTFHVRLPLH